MILQLKLSGKFEKLAGLVVGDFTDIKDNEQPFGLTVNEIIAQAVEEYDFPVCFGFPAGHGEKNLALTFGKIWELDVSENSSRLKQLPLPLPVS
jgi:muramoyltetrapeptide carboxypeptidase